MQSYAGLYHILQKSSSMGTCCSCRRIRERHCGTEDHRRIDNCTPLVRTNAYPLQIFAHPPQFYNRFTNDYCDSPTSSGLPINNVARVCLQLQPHISACSLPICDDESSYHSAIDEEYLIAEETVTVDYNNEAPTTTDYQQHSGYQALMGDNKNSHVDFITTDFHATTPSDHDHHASANLQPLSDHSHPIADDESSSSINHSAKPYHEIQTLTKCNQELTESLLNCSLSIIPALLARELISDETVQGVCTNSNPYIKATALVSNIRSKVKLNPEKFHDLVSVLREHTWTKDIAGVLQSVYGGLFNNV